MPHASDHAHPFETASESRRTEIHIRQGGWLHLRRVLALFIDYALYATLAFSLAVAATMLMERMTGIGGAQFASHGFSEQSVNAFYTLSAAFASVTTLAIVVIYVGLTLGGRRQATLGMRILGLRLERLDNTKITARYGIAHFLLFLATATIFTPLVLFAPFVLTNRQTLHDRLLDIVILGSAENLIPGAKL
ncbi:RDD family protein [Nitratireductor kimnyeongensis]|uniref:RDD family protein n=1 Tax=Nitratireductor kimnyeongensis TaxID=430679 RepID=A0ABW0T4N0_9HYPH|nr:RDD family protein [Nitratireductor kimnyeongensis]QZZ35192.1 RDD family protein [Nitratireductor kimnyeongensis]